MEKENPSGQIKSLYQNLSPEEKVEVLFRKYYAGLCKSLYWVLRDATFAEDVVQEVFMKVWEMRDKLTLDEAIQAYLYRACYHTALNFLKQQQKHIDDATLPMLPGTEAADGLLQFAETENQILSAIAALPPKTRLVFSLSRFEELSYKEIAERLEISVKSVEKHMGIALLRLREHLKSYLAGLVFLLLGQLF